MTSREKQIKIVFDAYLTYKWDYNYVIGLNACSLKGAIKMLAYEIEYHLLKKCSIVIKTGELKEIIDKIDYMYEKDLWYKK